jgi:cell division protein FtsL
MELMFILFLIIIISLIAYAYNKEQLLSILEERFDDLTEENENLKKALLKYKARKKIKK